MWLLVLATFEGGVVFGIVLCGGMEAANRQARRGRHIRMPAEHRFTAAYKISAAEPSWAAVDPDATLLPGQLTAIGEAA